MDHRYSYFHQNPNVLANGRPTYNRSSADGTQPTNNYTGSISSTSSRDQSPFNDRQHLNSNAVPLTNNHSYQMDSYNQPPRSSGPPRTNAKGIYDTSQSSIPNAISLAQSSAENYPINPDFQLQPHLTGLLPQQSKTVPELNPDINYKTNKGSIAANMNTNYFSSNKSYPEPKIIEYDMEETSTESSPQHTSSLYSESTDQDSESTNPSNTFSRHTLIKNTECHVTKESKSITSQSQDIPVPSQFADLNLSKNDINNDQHNSILHNAYQNDMSEDIPLSENISYNETEPIIENQENLKPQFNEHRFNMPKTYNNFSSKDIDRTELTYDNKQRSSPSDSNSITNYSLHNVTNSSNIPQSKTLFPYNNTKQFKKPEAPNINNYQNNMDFENYNQQNKQIQPTFQDPNFPIDSKPQSNVNTNVQKNIILDQSTSQAQLLNTQSNDQSIHPKAADLCYQQTNHNTESVTHQSMYGFFKPAGSEMNNCQSITSQHFTTYSSSGSTKFVDPMTSAATTDPISRSSSTISEAIVQENQSSPYHTANDQTRYLRNLSSSAKNSPIDLNNQDSTNLVKSEFDNKVSLSPSSSLIENQQDTSIDQSKLVDKESDNSNEQQRSVKSLPSPSITNFTQPNNYNFQSDLNYQQFQLSAVDGCIKTSTIDQLPNNSINLVTQSMNQNLIMQPSTSTTNHSISKYFDSVSTNNQPVLNQQSINVLPHSQPHNLFTQDLKLTSSSSSPSNNVITSSNVRNTTNVIYSSQQSPFTKTKSEATGSLMTSKEMVSSDSSHFEAINNLRKDSFQNVGSKSSNSQIPDNVSLNNQLSNLAIDNKQNVMPVDEKFNQEQTEPVLHISKEKPFDKGENLYAFKNSSSGVHSLNSSASEFSNINSTSYFTASKNVTSFSPGLNQPAANQFPPQQLNNKVTSSNIQSVSSATNQSPSKMMNTNFPISDAMSPTVSQHSIQLPSNQYTAYAVPSSSQMLYNQPKLDISPAQQSTSNLNVTPTAVVSSAMNQRLPQVFSNHPKSDAEPSQQTSNFNSTQQINTPMAVAPVSSVFNQFPPQKLYDQPKASTTQHHPEMASSFIAQPFNNQQTPAVVRGVSSAFDQLPPSTLSNQPVPGSKPIAATPNSFKEVDHQSTVNTVPSVPSDIKRFPSQMLNGPANSEFLSPLQPATSSYPLNSLSNQSTQNSIPSKTNQLPPSILTNSSKLSNFQPASSQYAPQTLGDQSAMNMVSPVPYETNQLPPQVLSNQFKANVPPVQTTSSWYSSQSFNNQHMSNMVQPVPSVANQVPSQIYSSQSTSNIVPPLQPLLNQYPSQLPNNQPSINQLSSNTFVQQSVANKYPSRPISHQQGLSNQNQPPLNNQLYNQANSVQPNLCALQPNTNQPFQLPTTPQFSNQINPMLSQQKAVNLSSNFTAMPPYVSPTVRPVSNMLSPNSLSSNNHFNQVQGNEKVQQSQPPITSLGQNLQFPQQSSLGISNQINYQQPSANYGQGFKYQPQGSYMPEQNASVVQQGFAKTWGHDTLDLLKSRDVLPSDGVQPPEIKLPQGYSNCDNCSPDIFRCTLNKFPSSKNLLDKSRLPLGILIHPYKDLSRLTVIQCENITRCRNCRSYINPFVQFIDNAHWKCNLCYRVNELPAEFQIDPYTKRLGDPSRRPEILNATIEYIASQDYMVRPPQPALYLFLIDVSRIATLTGYLEIVCDRILNKIMGNEIPGDSRTNIGFITYDSAVHFYQIANNDGGQPKQLIVSDISDIFLPLPTGLMVNIEENKSAIKDLLTSLPNLYKESYNTGCALGAALQAAFKMLKPRGGRVTVFQASLPNIGPGSLQPRDDGTPCVGDSVQLMTPSTDFYKKLALECSAEQIAVDMFFVSSQYVDIATISGISKYSAGCIHYFPQFDVKSPTTVTRLINCFDRYLSRKIGFEALLRLRCTRGVAIHSFHGNFFVRSSDLLMLPNVNPDNAYGMQLSIEDSLDGVSVVCFQAALLYTSSNAERRIRVHTLCIPVTDNLNDVFHNADQQAITCLIAKMAVDRSTEKSLSDAREAFFNAISDSLSAFKLGCSSYNGPGTMLSPLSLKVFPLYILATLKHTAFRTNQPTRLDERMFSMCQMKSLPLHNLVQFIYPDLYPLHNLEEQPKIDYEKLTQIPLPPVIQLSAERVESNGIYLMDDSETLTIFVGHRCSDQLIQQLFGYVNVNSMPELMTSLAEVDSKQSYLLRSFISYLQHFKSYPLPIEIIKDNGPHKVRFYSRLTEDKFESSLSYYEFLQRLSQQVR